MAFLPRSNRRKADDAYPSRHPVRDAWAGNASLPSMLRPKRAFNEQRLRRSAWTSSFNMGKRGGRQPRRRNASMQPFRNGQWPETPHVGLAGHRPAAPPGRSPAHADGHDPAARPARPFQPCHAEAGGSAGAAQQGLAQAAGMVPARRQSAHAGAAVRAERCRRHASLRHCLSVPAVRPGDAGDALHLRPRTLRACRRLADPPAATARLAPRDDAAATLATGA